MRTHEAIEADEYRRVEALAGDRRVCAARSELVRGVETDPGRRSRNLARDRRPRAAGAAGDAAVPLSLRRRNHGEDGLPGLAARQLPALRRRARLLGDHPGRRTAADLLALHVALAFHQLACPCA